MQALGVCIGLAEVSAGCEALLPTGKAMISRLGPFEFGAEVVEGVSVCHERLVAHRDLKPGLEPAAFAC